MTVYDRFKDPEYIHWAKRVKVRDRFACQMCGDTNTYLHSHHLMSWDMFIDQRFDLNNGITLCQLHHEYFHRVYGSGRNTKYQFEEFQYLYGLLRKIAKDGV